MSKRNEPAFPEARLENDPGGVGVGILHYPGLTKRELFAAMAMQGRLGNKHSGYSTFKDTANEAAKLAVQCADALLAELEKSK